MESDLYHIYRDKAGEAVEPNAIATASTADIDEVDRPKGGLSGYAALSMETTEVVEEEDQDFGGLMVRSLIDHTIVSLICV